jgi:shikimate dehydrogenase
MAPATPAAPSPEEVDYISGATRVFGIVGDPIEQVRSPEMFTAAFRARGMNAVMVPLRVGPEDFAASLAGLMRVQNLDGLIFTIPHKARAMPLASEIGPQARAVGAINALARRRHGWAGEIFDGLGCVEAFRRRGLGFAGKRVMLIGAGGAGSAVGVAIASEHPAFMRLHDLDSARAHALATKIRSVSPDTQVEVASPDVQDVDILLNVSPTGMLGDARVPFPVDRLPSRLVVFDAIVMPERTPLIELATNSGCMTIFGREMMRGQIARMVDFFRGE